MHSAHTSCTCLHFHSPTPPLSQSQFFLSKATPVNSTWQNLIFQKKEKYVHLYPILSYCLHKSDLHTKWALFQWAKIRISISTVVRFLGVRVSTQYYKPLRHYLQLMEHKITTYVHMPQQFLPKIYRKNKFENIHNEKQQPKTAQHLSRQSYNRD